MSIWARARLSMIGVGVGIACSYGLACASEPRPTYEEVCTRWCQRTRECLDAEPNATACANGYCANVPEQCREGWTELALCLDDADAGVPACPTSFGFIDFDIDEAGCTEPSHDYLLCLFAPPPDD